MSDLSIQSFTGRQRRRTTHWSVKLKDRLSHFIITVGGLGIILAVATVFVFLVSVALPLFKAPEVDRASAASVATLEDVTGVPVHVAADEYNLLAWSVMRDGRLRKFRLDTGEVLDEICLVGDGPSLTSWSFPRRDSLAVLGFEDGSVRFVEIAFTLSFLDLHEAPEALRGLNVGEVLTLGNGLAQRTPQGQIRLTGLRVDFQEPIATGSDQPVLLLDHTRSRNDIHYAAMTADGRVVLQRASGRQNMMTRQIVYRTTTVEIPYPARQTPPQFLKLTGLGDNLYLLWEDGILQRFDIRDLQVLSLVETVDLTPDADTRITAVGQMIGKTTLLVGDSKGSVTGWFRVRSQGTRLRRELSVRMRELDVGPDGRNRGQAREIQVRGIPSGDGLALIPARRLEAPESGSAVVSLGASERKRMFVAGHADGRIRIHNTTVEKFQFEVRMHGDRPASFVLLNPRDQGLVSFDEHGGFELWSVAIPHSESTVAGYFRPIWYEGADEPAHTWQSTGGTDDFESKFGLMPLIFGTIKATLYSMLFAVPIAILAAIYTSEFMSPKAKATIKPTIEMMASLPSVVLGFLAGLVLAQFIESRVPATLLSFVTVPFFLVLAAAAWQTLSRTAQMRLARLRFLLMFLAIPIGIWIAGVAGPVFEQAFFDVRILDPETAQAMVGELPETQLEFSREGHLIVRDLRVWLSANRQDEAEPKFESSPLGGWLLLFLPLCSLATALLGVRYLNPFFLSKAASASARRFAWLDLLKLLAMGGVAILAALFLSWVFGLLGDLRGGLIDQYGQRNAMVVGFMMGFAVVPIIYTISDDAMSAVPEHLRSASLGAGATRWQTAVRIIIPTSMSGIFSAVMIGFGRAVGETMIVLMAAGNTPIMEWNIFSGFRTLSANIAVEMMEAVENSTNYRTLFLAAVLLFAMTFIINTVAEKVRQSYRKKAYQL